MQSKLAIYVAAPTSEIDVHGMPIEVASFTFNRVSRRAVHLHPVILGVVSAPPIDSEYHIKPAPLSHAVQVDIVVHVRCSGEAWVTDRQQTA